MDMDNTEMMAADIALTMNGGEWKDGKWYSKGHREAWIKAVKPYADEIERLREELRKANERHNPARADVAPIRGTDETSLEEGSRGTGFSQRSGGYGKETI